MKGKCIGFLFLEQLHSEYTHIAHCLSAHGIESQLIDLNNCEHIRWDDYSLINVRECRGYHFYPNFLPKIEALESKLGAVPMTNSFSVIRAAIDKAKYLRELELEGVDIIPTIWQKRGKRIALEDVIEKTGWHDFIVKPTVSSKSWNTFRIMMDSGEIKIAKAETRMSFLAIKDQDAFAELIESHDICIQKFMPEILSRGELSFVFIDNVFSHAVRKTVAPDNWLAHEFFGGKNEYYEATTNETKWARQIFKKLMQKYGDFLYARIDGIPDGQRLRLLECEIMVPRLFLSEGHAIERYVKAIKKRLL